MQSDWAIMLGAAVFRAYSVPVSGHAVLLAVGAIILVIALLVYGWVPLIVRAKQSIKAQVVRQPVDLEQLPVDVAAMFVHAHTALAPEGFTSVVILRSQPIPNVIGYCSLLRHSSLPDWGQIIVVETIPQAHGQIPRRVKCIGGFDREYVNRESIGTGNSRTAGFHPSDPLAHDLSAPQVTDPVVLWRLHCARVRRLSSSMRAAPKFIQPGHEIEHFEERETRGLKRCLDRGYYYLDDKTGLYRKTLKGAYLMTWKLLPPIKQVRRWVNERRASAEMRMLPAELLQSNPTPPPPLASVRSGR
jgi:hypothetical protein